MYMTAYGIYYNLQATNGKHFVEDNFKFVAKNTL